MQGRVVTPGFNDAHIHFGADPQGFNLQFKTMEPSWEETSTAIEAAAKHAPTGTWIFGFVGANVVLNGQVTRFALERVAPDHPVRLRSFYGHGYIVNSNGDADLADCRSTGRPGRLRLERRRERSSWSPTVLV